LAKTIRYGFPTVHAVTLEPSSPQLWVIVTLSAYGGLYGALYGARLAL
jgi:hypothetical protein